MHEREVGMGIKNENAPFVRMLPLLMNDGECNIFIWWPGLEDDGSDIGIGFVFDDDISRGFGFVDQIWIEDIELVSLDGLGRRIISIVVCLIILVPLVARVHSIDILRLARPVLVVPGGSVSASIKGNVNLDRQKLLIQVFLRGEIQFVPVWLLLCRLIVHRRTPEKDVLL